MNMIDIYKSIKRGNLLNNVYAKYWIYDLNDTLIQLDGIEKRKIMIHMFDRNHKNHEVLNEITFSINGSKISSKDIRRIKTQDTFELSCELLVDPNVKYSKIYISDYILNNQKTNLLMNYYIKGIVYEGDEGKLNACKMFLTQDQYQIAPEYNNMFWFCKCGYANLMENETCPCCGASKNQMISIADTHKKALIMNHLPSRFKLDTKSSVRKQVNTFVEKASNIFSINPSFIASLFDMDELQIQQDQMIEKEITNYLNTHMINWNHNLSFEENLDAYVSNITTDMISKEKVHAYMNLIELKNDYYADKKRLEESESKRNKGSFFKKIIFGTSIVLVICLIAYVIMMQQGNIKDSSANGIVIKDTIQYRTKEFKKINLDDEAPQINYFDNIKKYEKDAPSNFVKYCKDQSIDSLEKLLDDNKIIASTRYLTNKPKKIETQVIKNKKFRPLSEDVFIIEETINLNTEKQQQKTYIYLGDATGKVLYGADKEDSYFISKYDGKNLSEQVYYVKGEEKVQYVYKYKENDTLSSMSISTKDGSDWIKNKTISFKNDKVLSKKCYIANSVTQKYQYKYNKHKKLYKMELVDDHETKIQNYMNGHINKYMYEKDNNRINKKLYYTAGGLKSSTVTRSYEDSKKNRQKLSRLFYNFEYGLVFEAEFCLNKEGKYVLFNLSVQDIQSGITLPHLDLDILPYHLIETDFIEPINDTKLSIYYAELNYDGESSYDLAKDEPVASVKPIETNNQNEPTHSIDLTAEYLFPTDTQYIKNTDLQGLSQNEVAMIRNEIYARHGYAFQSEPFKSYFNEKGWYEVNKNYSEDLLSEIEWANAKFIQEYEIDMGWIDEEDIDTDEDYDDEGYE